MEQRLQDEARRDEHGKPYTSPRLVPYGDFHRLTRATGGSRAIEDSGTGTGTKDT